MKIIDLLEDGAGDEIEWRNGIENNRTNNWNKLAKGWFIVDKTGKRLRGPFTSSEDANRFRNNRSDLPTPNYVKEV